MSELTESQKKEIIVYCENNEDRSFDHIAEMFTKKFNRPVTRDDVYTLYLYKQVGFA